MLSTCEKKPTARAPAKPYRRRVYCGHSDPSCQCWTFTSGFCSSRLSFGGKGIRLPDTRWTLVRRLPTCWLQSCSSPVSSLKHTCRVKSTSGSVERSCKKNELAVGDPSWTKCVLNCLRGLIIAPSTGKACHLCVPLMRVFTGLSGCSVHATSGLSEARPCQTCGWVRLLEGTARDSTDVSWKLGMLIVKRLRDGCHCARQWYRDVYSRSISTPFPVVCFNKNTDQKTQTENIQFVDLPFRSTSLFFALCPTSWYWSWLLISEL